LGAFEDAENYFPGGVNSPVRSFQAVGGVPPVIDRGEGARIFAGEERYIDYVMSWGPLLFGHARHEILDASKEAMEEGTTFGLPSRRETEFAARVSDFFPFIEKMRLVSSGTEATMTAARLARGYTGRTKIIKFDGAYHGHSDAFLGGAGSGVATLGIEGVPGIPPAFLSETILIPWNDSAVLNRVFNENEIAAIILEPVLCNAGCIPPEAGFLESCMKICTAHGALVIFDEIITGFRLARGGASEFFGLEPDLVTLGKVIGGGISPGPSRRTRGYHDDACPCRRCLPGGYPFREPCGCFGGKADTRTNHTGYL